ncbi:MAG: hypothetical protein JRI46_01830 [Deltaproteobacteria bacterium]|nr:hypothetical protein [Deltaproteobacteria bacterium]
MRVHRGSPSRPLLILVRGLGMTERTWTDPYQGDASILIDPKARQLVLGKLEELP